MKPSVTVLMFGSKARTGKDQSCKYLINKYDFCQCAFAEKLKNTVIDLYDFTTEQMFGTLKDVIDNRYGITPRKVLQDFGNEQRKRYPNIWADYLFKWIDNEIDLTLSSIDEFKLSVEEMGIKDLYCISDFRFKNEYDVAYNWSLDCSKVNKKLYTIKIDRPKETTPEISNSNDISELDLNDFTRWNFMINNNGTIEQLNEKLDYILKCIND